MPIKSIYIYLLWVIYVFMTTILTIYVTCNYFLCNLNIKWQKKKNILKKLTPSDTKKSKVIFFSNMKTKLSLNYLII